MDDMGNQLYAKQGEYFVPINPRIFGSIDNGEIDVEYSPPIDRKICAADERFASVNEAIGRLEYNLEQHIEKCADGLAPLADFITSSWAVMDEFGKRLEALEKAQPKPMSDAYAHIPIAEWLDFKEELEAARVRLAELRKWAADANTYISAARDAMCEEMDAQPADKIFDGPLWEALSSAGDIGIRGLLEYYAEITREAGE